MPGSAALLTFRPMSPRLISSLASPRISLGCAIGIGGPSAVTLLTEDRAGTIRNSHCSSDGRLHVLRQCGHASAESVRKRLAYIAIALDAVVFGLTKPNPTPCWTVEWSLS